MIPERIPLARPSIDKSDIDAVCRVLESGRLSQGPALASFEAEFSSSLGLRDPGVGVSSGTGGLLLVMDALGVRPGDEVITPSLTFSATANAIARLGARPVFVDVCATDLNMNPRLLEAAIGPKTKAIIVVHLFGRMAEMTAIRKVADRNGVAIIEDACEAIGASSAAGPAGTLGNAGVFSFYANKPMTAAEGGMIVSRDATLLAQCRQQCNQGRDANGKFSAAAPGFNFRLSDLHAALGLSQLRRLPQLLSERERVARLYGEGLEATTGLMLPPVSTPPDRHIWFTYPLRLGDEFSSYRDRIRAQLADRGVETGDYFPPVHRLPYYRKTYPSAGDSLPVTEREARRLLALPLFAGMTTCQVEAVTERLRDVLAGGK